MMDPVLMRRNRIMLSDQIIKALDTMGVTISEVARAGGCTPSNLNRIKNGVRTPSSSSPTIRFLTDGFLRIAHERHLSGELVSLCGAKLSDDKETLRTKLIDWLYKDEPPYVRKYQKRKESGRSTDRQAALQATEFSGRLDRLMKTAEVSNRRLGREVGIDQSYISRLRRGERIPRYDSPYLIRICTLLRNRTEAGGKLKELSELTRLSEAELSGMEGAENLRKWLFGYGTVMGYLAADELLETISSIDEILKKQKEAASNGALSDSLKGYDIEKLIAADQPKGSNDIRYAGIGGLRSVVTRFLGEFIQNGEHELLLYSDQSMEWMSGEYRPILTLLMAEIIRRDVEIKIVHTVDRSMQELVSAIEWWMPLYLTGKITSYYCQPGAGNRFSHTLFIRPGAACIAGTSAVGLEERGIYHYSQDGEMIDLARDSFDSILKESLPLVQIQKCDGAIPENDKYVRTDEMMIRADSSQVVIRRAEPPYMMFTFTHPLIVRAFRAYMAAQP
ncbi:MAG: helix-turn-helix transcriptional regulator [Eubacterium sp.]|nr:helix-turn-helix transcriptional regulator [Eubacterium sp.]